MMKEGACGRSWLLISDLVLAACTMRRIAVKYTDTSFNFHVFKSDIRYLVVGNERY